MKKGKLIHPEWSKNSTIYEVNIRQYTEEGTLKAFITHLPRLKDMGIDILWFMPIQPIGLLNRKGTLGSNYSISDYCKVNPEFGTISDFKEVVQEAHKLNMYVILDWVANHTAWDHSWVLEHKDWYKLNSNDELTSYTYDNGKELEYWTDVIGLNYEEQEVHYAMEEAMLYWINEADIDGFRCDVAGLVPLEFWKKIRIELEKIKPVFMLAEWSTPEMHEAFDMTYEWGVFDHIVAIAEGREGPKELVTYIEARSKTYSKNDYRMTFTTNHDKNSWEGSDEEFFGYRRELFTALSVLLPGMPLVYSGQESGLDKRLDFFEKCAIDWDAFKYHNFYKELFSIKKQHQALWQGENGGTIRIETINNDHVLKVTRTKDDDFVIGLFNMTDDVEEVTLSQGIYEITSWSYEIIE